MRYFSLLHNTIEQNKFNYLRISNYVQEDLKCSRMLPRRRKAFTL